MADDILTNEDEAAKLAANEAAEIAQGYTTMMSTTQSRRVMWDRFEVFGIYQAAPSVETQALAWNEGRRCLALQVMHDLILHCPELYDLMVVENRDRLSRENLKR